MGLKEEAYEKIYKEHEDNKEEDMRLELYRGHKWLNSWDIYSDDTGEYILRAVTADMMQRLKDDKYELRKIYINYYSKEDK